MFLEDDEIVAGVVLELVATRWHDTFLVVEQKTRKIYQFSKSPDGDRKELFADISHEAITGQFEGVLCLAFHPNFLQNRKYYLNYHVRENDIFSPVIVERQATADLDGERVQVAVKTLELPGQQQCQGTVFPLVLEPLGEGLDLEAVQDLRQIPEAFMQELKILMLTLKTPRGLFQGLLIPVQGNQLTGPTQPGEDLLGMPPCSVDPFSQVLGEG